MTPEFLLEIACAFLAAGIIALSIGFAMAASRLDQAEEKLARLLAMRSEADILPDISKSGMQKILA
jgi:hypothetical protein